MNIDTMNKRASSLGGEVLWIKLIDGVVRVRVVARPGEEEPWREVYRHFLQNYVQAEDFPKAPICLGDDSCPGCRITAQIRAGGDDLSANKAKAQRRFIWVALSRDNPYDDDGNLKLKVLESPPTVFQGMARAANEWGIDFTDPVAGYDLDIMRSSGSGIPKYEVKAVTTREGTTMSVVQSPLTEEEQKLVDEAFPDVDMLTQPPEYRRFALALGFPVDETIPEQPGRSTQEQPPLPPPAKQPESNQPPPPPPANQPESNQPPSQPANQPGSEVVEGETVCPYFGSGFDAEDDACRECNTADACKTQSEGGQEEPPKRRPAK